MFSDFKKSAASLAGIVVIAMLGPVTGIAQQNGFQKFVDGERLTYSTAGNPKASGLVVTFDYPAGWSGADGRRPNTLYQVTSEKGRGLELCNLVIRGGNLVNGPDVASRDIEQLFDPKGLKDLVPQGSRFISGSRTTLDGQPGAWVQFSQETDRAGISLQLIWVMYQVYYEGRFIFFSCSVGDGGEKPRELVEARFRSTLPLFQVMANSVIIQSRWRK